MGEAMIKFPRVTTPSKSLQFSFCRDLMQIRALFLAHVLIQNHSLSGDQQASRGEACG